MVLENFNLNETHKNIHTGTPLQNNLTELYALLNLLYATVFIDSGPFDDAFQLNSSDMKIDRDVLDQAHYLLRPLMLRRLKSEVETKLPPRRETKVVCPLAHVRYNFSHSHHKTITRTTTLEHRYNADCIVRS